MILSKRIPVLVKHLKHNLRRTLTSDTTSDACNARKSPISKPDTGKNYEKIVFYYQFSKFKYFEYYIYYLPILPFLKDYFKIINSF